MELKPKNPIGGPRLRSSAGEFTFNVVQNSSKIPEFANNLDRERVKLVELAHDYFPSAVITTDVVFTPVAEKFSDLRREYTIRLKIVDRASSPEEMDDLLNDFSQELRLLGHGY